LWYKVDCLSFTTFVADWTSSMNWIKYSYWTHYTELKIHGRTAGKQAWEV